MVSELKINQNGVPEVFHEIGRSMKKGLEILRNTDNPLLYLGFQVIERTKLPNGTEVQLICKYDEVGI